MEIKDMFNQTIKSGDIITYLSCAKKCKYMKTGVFIDDFNNGKGWKIRVRSPEAGSTNIGYSDNALIGPDGRCANVIKIPDDLKTDLGKIVWARTLRENLIKNGELKVEEKGTVESLEDLPISGVLDLFGAPESLLKGG